MRIVCQKFEGSVWRCLLILFLQYLSYLNNILGTIASHEMVENIKITKKRGLGMMDEFISRFTDFEYPSRNEGKTASYYDSIKKGCIISNCQKENLSYKSSYKSKLFGEILSRFEGKKLNLRTIMDWPVTSKSYTIAAEDRKVHSNSKSLFRNHLQGLCEVKPLRVPPTAIQTSIVDVMRVVRMISIKNANPPIFLSWEKNV